MRQFEYIAIHHADGSISRMQFVTRASASSFDGRGAANAGFIFDPATREWVREATQENVQREIGRSSFPKEIAAPDGWKVIDRADLVTVRQDFDRIPARKQLRVRG